MTKNVRKGDTAEWRKKAILELLQNARTHLQMMESEGKPGHIRKYSRLRDRLRGISLRIDKMQFEYGKSP